MSNQTNALTFNEFVTQLSILTVINTTTVNGIVQATPDAAWFNEFLPSVLAYSENRIQRDLDLLSLLTSKTYALTTGSNLLAIPVADFVTIQTIGVIVNGALNPLLPVSKEYIQAVWGDPTALGQPLNFAMYGGDASTYGNTSMMLLFGPYPDQNYPVAAMGTVRAASLYTTDQTAAGSATTFISTWLPDLLIQAAMIMVSEYQRDYTATGSDPNAPGTFENQYQTLLKGAIVEEARRRWQAPAWSSESPTVIASASRGDG